MSTTLLQAAGPPIELADEALDGLRAEIRGGVHTPEDDGYASARRPYNAMHVDRPSLLVRCAGTADVVAAVDFARSHGIELTVRGGGHSIAGLSSNDGGMLLDLSGMRGVDVDPDARVARVRGGAVLGDVDHETQAFGLAAPLGVVSETGVAGLTLGGGYGWLRRKHGLACDNVLGAEVAFAGVFYGLDDAAQVLRGYREYFAGAPDEVSAEAILFCSAFPADPHLPEPVHGQKALVVGAVYAGDVDAGMKELQVLRELATPLADISQPMPFVAVQGAFDGFFPRGQLHAYWKSLYARELPDETIDRIVQRAKDRPAGRSEFELAYLDVYPMGGAVSRVAPEATSFGERSAPYLVSLGGN